MSLSVCPNCFSEKVGSTHCVRCKAPLQHKDDGRSLQPGTVLADSYIVGRQLGAGGFGITYLAWDIELKRKVALKEFLPSKIAARSRDRSTVVPRDEECEDQFTFGLKKFLEEAQIVANCQHPSIVQIFKYFKQFGTAYYAMNYVSGKTLQDKAMQQGGPLREKEVLDAVLPLLDGLEYLHTSENMILHRDIKPSNIFLPENHLPPLLLDFGAARHSIMNRDRLSVFLTHGYAPFEQYQSEGRQGPGTDLYALGATMYCCLQGAMDKGRLMPPVRATDRKNGKPLPHIREVARHPLSDAVADAVMKSLEMSPSQRFQSAREMKKCLLEKRQALPAAPSPIPESRPEPPPLPAEDADYELHCLAGEFEGQSLPLSGEPLTVGRNVQKCTLIIENSIVSNTHCSFLVHAGEVHVTDLNSTNGTYINDTKRLSPHEKTRLKPGDTISLAGVAVFKIEARPKQKKDASQWVSVEPPPEKPKGRAILVAGAVLVSALIAGLSLYIYYFHLAG